MQRIEAVDGQSLAIPALPSRLIAGQARLLAEVAESDSSQLLGKDRRHMARSWISKPTRGAGPFRRIIRMFNVPDFVKILSNSGKFLRNVT